MLVECLLAKFCKKFIFNIYECITNFSLMWRVGGSWLPNKCHRGGQTTQLVAQRGLNCPINITLLPPGDLGPSSKSESVTKTEEMLLAIITSNLLS